MRTIKFWYSIFLILLAFTTSAVAQIQSNIPKHIIETLDSLKKADNLTDWLYTRIDYSVINRRQSLPFLMSTQKAAWRKALSVSEREAWLVFLSNQGYNQLFSGNILESINCYEQAYNYCIDNKLNIESITDYVLKPWANNYTRLGDYEKAIFLQQKLLDIALKQNDNELIASAYNNMAISYRSLGDFKKAKECIESGIKKITPTSSLNILLDNTLADIYKDKNDIVNAEKVINRNVIRQKKIKQDTQTAYWLLSSYSSAGDIQLAKQNFNLAQNYYQQALKLNESYYKGNRLREKAYIITQLGTIKLNQKNGNEALNYFNQTLNTLGLIGTDKKIRKERIYGDNRLVDVFYQKAMVYLLLGNETEALDNIRLSLVAADKIRFELADVKTKQRFQGEMKQKAEKAVAIAFNLLGKTQEHHYAEVIADIFEQTKARTLLDDIRRNQQQLTIQNKDTLFAYKQTLERAIAFNDKELLQDPKDIKSIGKNNAELKFKLEYVEKQLRERYPALNIATDTKDYAPLKLLKQLPSNTHFIEYFCGMDHIYALEIKHGRVKHVKRIPNADGIKKLITDFANTYYHNGPAAMINRPKDFFTTSNSIYTTLLGGFDLKKSEKIILIPDEFLGYLSFDGLITDDKYSPSISAWPYLIKKTTISYAFSIQTWLNQSQKKTLENKTFSGLFITHQNNDKQNIPAVAKEAEAIEKIVAGSFLIDEDASVKNFFKAFDESAVLHISTHSYLSGTQQEPTLALNDDQVFLFELSARKYAPALVVLSACRTADGMMAAGEGIISLNRGFTAIGTQGTIAGLWNVNDDAAAKITANSYQSIIKGEEVGTALHLSKLNWLSGKRNTEQEYLPYYWDALIYMGYDQKIALQPAGLSWAHYTIIGAIIIALLAFTLLVLKPRLLKAGYLMK